MSLMTAVVFLVLVVMVGFYLLFSCAAEYGPSNDWHGLVRSSRFLGGLALSFAGVAVLILILRPLG